MHYFIKMHSQEHYNLRIKTTDTGWIIYQGGTTHRLLQTKPIQYLIPQKWLNKFIFRVIFSPFILIYKLVESVYMAIKAITSVFKFIAFKCLENWGDPDNTNTNITVGSEEE